MVPHPPTFLVFLFISLFVFRFTHIPSSHLQFLSYIFSHKTAHFVTTGSWLFTLPKLEFFLPSIYASLSQYGLFFHLKNQARIFL
jgi:hypothetical protein